jgi:UDP-N-acetylmuramyl pentapeptide synthase
LLLENCNVTVTLVFFLLLGEEFVRFGYIETLAIEQGVIAIHYNHMPFFEFTV